MNTKVKYLLIIILLMINAWQSSIYAQNSNEIDSIKTDSDVIFFLTKHFEEFKDFNFENIYYDKLCKKIADSLKLDLWRKADFDNNGLTDLFVFKKNEINSFFVIFAFKDHFQKNKPLYKDVFESEYFPKVDSIGSLYCIKIYQFDKCVYERKKREEKFYSPQFKMDSSENEMDKHYLVLDTLVYKYGYFIELNKKVNRVKKISIKYNNIFLGRYRKITLKNNRRFRSIKCSKFHIQGTMINLPYKGSIHIRKIPKNEFENLWLVIDYINWDGLKSDYKNECCDDASDVSTKVLYNNNKRKTIYRYCTVGTYGMGYIESWIESFEKRHFIRQQKRHDKRGARKHRRENRRQEKQENE